MDHAILQSVAWQLLDWKQSAGPAKLTISVDGQAAKVRLLGRGRLRAVTFSLAGRGIEAIEQNPEKPSQWGKLAREGHQVVQFKDVNTNRYLAVSIDGKIREYSR